MAIIAYLLTAGDGSYKAPRPSSGMDDQRRAWDREYSKPHPMWKGPSKESAIIPAGKRILELGCGNGKTVSSLVRGGGDVIGLDISHQGLLACQRAKGMEDLDLVEGDAARLPFAERTMDHVVAFHVLGHLTEQGRRMAVEEIKRVIKLGGTVMVRVFSSDDMRFGGGDEIEPNTFVKGTGIFCHFFTREELLDLFSAFQILSMEEVKVPKRFDGRDLVRSELFGTFSMKGDQLSDHG